MPLPSTMSCPHCRCPVAIPGGYSGGPSLCPHCGNTVTIESPAGDSLSGPEVYNLISDIGAGVNVRWRDNLFQLAAIGIGLLLGIIIGALAVQDRIPGAVVGGFIGVLAGLFGSGIFLMIYRFIRHLLGYHK
jgi:hypothetical protein